MVLLKEARSHSDAALVDECRKGDASAFDELVRRYKDRVYNVIYRFLGNREDALDVSQEVFLRAYRGIQDFRGASQVYTWLHSIAANLARNRLRDRGRKGRDCAVSLEGLADAAPGLTEEAASTSRTPSDAAMEQEMQVLLQQFLNELPDHYRLAFVLRTFEDLSYEEIADVMGCPVGTVKSRLNQARGMLRNRLKEIALF